MKASETFLLSVFLFSLLNSQPKFEFSGYAVNLPVIEVFSDTLANYYNTGNRQFVDLTRIRLRSVLRLWRNSRIEGEYEADGVYFSNESNLLGTDAVKTNRQLIRLSWKPVDEKHFSLTHFIDRLYLRQGFNGGSFILGRQRISWGTGRIWNPTDLFNPINPASFFKEEKDGADAVSGKYAFGSFTDINLVFNPREKISNSNYGLRFRTNYKEYDMSVMGGFFDKRIIGGADFAGNFFDAGVRGEGIISVNKDSTQDKFVKLILGIDNQFSPELYALLEYHFNGEGTTDRTKYDFRRLANGEIQNVGKNYICISGFYQFNPLLYISLTGITNLNDASGFLNLLGDFSAKDNLSLSLGAQITFGREKSEYWYYPASVYLMVKYYF